MTEPSGIRIAVWSGPRNISTALMRAWESRADTFVCDEPLYAGYLAATGADHPGREEILAAHETDWRRVVAWLTGEIPAGKTIFYQKHMAHHLLPEIDRGWLRGLRHALLIRSPAEMLTSLLRVIPNPTLEDTGLPQQWELFRRLEAEGMGPPPVLDARDVLRRPRALLSRLCAALEVPFDEAMLHWAPGPRATDGVWARHWYARVERSTGFMPYAPGDEAVPERLRLVHEACEPYYQALYERRLTAD